MDICPHTLLMNKCVEFSRYNKTCSSHSAILYAIIQSARVSLLLYRLTILTYVSTLLQYYSILQCVLSDACYVLSEKFCAAIYDFILSLDLTQYWALSLSKLRFTSMSQSLISASKFFAIIGCSSLRDAIITRGLRISDIGVHYFLIRKPIYFLIQAAPTTHLKKKEEAHRC